VVSFFIDFEQVPITDVYSVLRPNKYGLIDVVCNTAQCLLACAGPDQIRLAVCRITFAASCIAHFTGGGNGAPP
jgi:hypothetical protein